MGLLVPQTHGTNESFVFRRLARESVADKGGLGHQTFP